MSTDPPAGPNHLLHGAPVDGDVPPSARPITAEKVVKVALNPDDELRNLQVALLYSLTSRRLNERLFPRRNGDGPTVNARANWFTIGQWAVLTVGKNLRARDMPHRAARLPEPLRRRLTPAILNLRASQDRQIAAALSFGQVMVLVSTYHALLNSSFADGPVIGDDPVICPPLVAKPSVQADVGETQGEDAARQAVEEDRLQRQTALELAGRLGANVARLTIFGPRSLFYRKVLRALAERASHKDELEHAFSLYTRAGPEAQAGAEVRTPEDLVFEATLRIIAIEQVIVDEAVTMVINHVPQFAAEQLEGRIATFAERSLRVPRRIAQTTTSRRLADVTAVAREMWARVMTDQVLVLAFPSETLRLGRDVPPRDWREPFYAEVLQELSPEAQALFDSFDRSLGDGRGAGAGDWRRFDDRMNFAANMLRSRFCEPSLHWQPFTDEDVSRIWEGRYPSRIGDPYEQAVRSPYYPDQLGRDLLGVAHNCSEPIR